LTQSVAVASELVASRLHGTIREEGSLRPPPLTQPYSPECVE
jgi:hypothetical protein